MEGLSRNPWRGWRGQLLFGLFCYLLFLGMKMPASWAYGRVAGWIPWVRMEGVSGTIWSGGFAALRLGASTLGAGRWRVAPEALPGRLAVDFTLGAPGAAWHAAGRAGLEGVSALFASGVTVEAEVEALRGVVGMIPPGSRGRVTGHLESLVVAQTGVRAAEGHGTGSGLHVGSPLNVDLGDLTGTLQPDEGHGLLLRVQDRAGPWQVRLTFGLKPDGSYRGRGHVAARDASDTRAGNLLRVLGPMDGQGRVEIREHGRLPGW
ncbi:MAG: type II secretion system protein N [Magnetococcales bacterium]|nr:type II secretion system protein N [Magnetococcales bacterium]